MYGKLVEISKDHEDDIITLNKEYRLMPAKNNKDAYIIVSDDNLNYLSINKTCFIINKKISKIKRNKTA